MIFKPQTPKSNLLNKISLLQQKNKNTSKYIKNEKSINKSKLQLSCQKNNSQIKKSRKRKIFDYKKKEMSKKKMFKTSPNNNNKQTKKLQNITFPKITDQAQLLNTKTETTRSPNMNFPSKHSNKINRSNSNTNNTNNNNNNNNNHNNYYTHLSNSKIKKRQNSIFSQNMNSINMSCPIESFPDQFLSLQCKIGKGSFGEVFLVTDTMTNQDFALKILNKQELKNNDMIPYAYTERSIMAQMDHPFIIKLHYAFQNDKNLFMFMQFAPCGNLSQLINRFTLTEYDIRIYTCQIILALEELHRHDILYRDLKPENVVLDHEGNALITDFGLSKRGIDDNEKATASFCGSVAYLAPEMLNKKGKCKLMIIY